MANSVDPYQMSYSVKADLFVCVEVLQPSQHY